MRYTVVNSIPYSVSSCSIVLYVFMWYIVPQKCIAIDFALQSVK